MNYSSPFTFTKVLSGISKTLGVANQVIPLYQQTKPFFKNIRGAYKLITAYNSTTKNAEKKIQNTTPAVESPKKIEEKTIISLNNSPQFFI